MGRLDRRKTWVAEIKHIGFQVADNTYPRISAVIADGPEAGRDLYIEIDIDSMFSVLEQMKRDRDA